MKVLIKRVRAERLLEMTFGGYAKKFPYVVIDTENNTCALFATRYEAENLYNAWWREIDLTKEDKIIIISKGEKLN